MNKFIYERLDYIMSFEEFNDNSQLVYNYLQALTSSTYTIAVVSERKWGNENSKIEKGKFYQIMPCDIDEGFFDWYCEIRPYNQFFKTIEMAIIHFVIYYQVYQDRMKNLLNSNKL